MPLEVCSLMGLRHGRSATLGTLLSSPRVPVIFLVMFVSAATFHLNILVFSPHPCIIAPCSSEISLARPRFLCTFFPESCVHIITGRVATNTTHTLHPFSPVFDSFVQWKVSGSAGLQGCDPVALYYFNGKNWRLKSLIPPFHLSAASIQLLSIFGFVTIVG